MTAVLSPRLKAAADLVPACECVFDIGTDHAWLPIWLVQNGRCRRAVAADLRTGPLERAARHIHDADLDEQIEVAQTDGLQGLDCGSSDVIVLAGLGGNEIMRILENRNPACRSLILQPMKSLPELRGWLYGQGYRIERESLPYDRGRYYPVMSCVYTGQKEDLALLEAWAGPVLLAERPPSLQPYLRLLQLRLLRHGRHNPDFLTVARQIGRLLEDQI
ncbi:MAG: class I SAM-dependent methyltransferase [Clostridiaceae bacterium]|nr:class I SAM-dependent methyltransferase [Clostridiaceae bacterium]